MLVVGKDEPRSPLPFASAQLLLVLPQQAVVADLAVEGAPQIDRVGIESQHAAPG